jgi:hypothetical protein
MRRALFVLVPLALLVPASTAYGDGCPAPCSGQSASPPGAKLLFVQPDGPAGQLVAYDTKTGRPIFALPPGRASADGRTHVAASQRARHGATVLVRYVVPSGRLVRAWQVPGRWALAAVSPTGRWAALSRRVEGVTRVAVVDLLRAKRVGVIRLRGNFEVETLSADGHRLFLIQHLDARRYLVRLYDFRARRLASEPLRGGDDRLMAGYAWSGIGSRDGRWLLTLYLDTRRSHAFVHALDLVKTQPRCIDLPSHGGFSRLRQYSLTLVPGGGRLLAANPALGVVAELDLATHRVVKRARFTAAAGGEAAARRGRASLLAAVSRNGRTLYFSNGRLLWAYDAAFGVVRGPYATGDEIVGLGYGAGDRRLHVVRKDGVMLTFLAATGQQARR